MDQIQILFLSFIQGLTEFLPVSSSGHLLVMPYLFGWKPQSLLFDVSVHLGTLCAVLVYYRVDIKKMTSAFLAYVLSGGKNDSDDMGTVLKIMFATLPVVFFGFLAKKFLLPTLRAPHVAVVSLIFFGVVMAFVDRFKPEKGNDITFRYALVIGIFQLFSIIPGASRSGMCLIGARLCRLDRSTATKFSFLLSIPAISAAAFLTGWDVMHSNVKIPWIEIIPGIIYSFIFGLCAIHFMISFVRQHSLMVFGIYRVVLGAFIALLVLR